MLCCLTDPHSVHMHIAHPAAFASEKAIALFSTDKIKTCRLILWPVEIEISSTGERKWMETSIAHKIYLEVVFLFWSKSVEMGEIGGIPI